MSDASFELQKALLAMLTDSSPQTLTVYDRVPDQASGASAPDSAFPYVQIGEMDAIPDDVDGASGRDDGEVETITLHVWSRYQGQKEVKQIMQQIKDRLHNQDIAVTGRASSICWVRSRRSFMDPDGKTRHGVMSIEVTHRN